MNRDGKGVIRLNHDKKGRIGLMPVDASNSSEVRWFETDPCAIFHTVCAWDTDTGGVVLYACALPEFGFDDPFKYRHNHMIRYDINVKKGIVTSNIEPVDVARCIGVERAFVDFPIVDPAVYGRRAKYAFGSILADLGDGKVSNAGIAKYNMETKEVEGVIRFESNGRLALGVGEAGFVPRKSVEGEDGAYLTSFVRDNDNNITMDVYDAVTMSKVPLARVHAPEGFHIPNGTDHSDNVPVVNMGSMQQGAAARDYRISEGAVSTLFSEGAVSTLF
eukprot:IDg12469t1